MMHSLMQALHPQPAMDEKPENSSALSQERCADRHPFEGRVFGPSRKEMTMLKTKPFDYPQQIPTIVKAMVGTETANGGQERTMDGQGKGGSGGVDLGGRR